MTVITPLRVLLLALAGGLLTPWAAQAQPRPGDWWPAISSPATAVHQPGRFVWADLVTDDVGRAVEFYGRVFDWTFETNGPADDDRRSYTVVLANGTPIGGMVFRDVERSQADRPGRAGSRWVGLVSVEDPKAVSERALRAGGRVLMSARPLGDRGDMAVAADADGAVFGVVRSASGDPADFVADVNQWLWIELLTSDPARAVAFYRSVLGYEARAADPANPQSYRLFSGGVARAGVIKNPVRDASSAWVPYVRVADVSATVARAMIAGARLLVGPTAHAGTRVALMVDPNGAPFAVAEWPGR